jgi:uncharacterized membrane protein
LTGRRLPIALVCGWALLCVAWVFGNPPFAAPDEGDHYVRAVAVGGGQLIGDETDQLLPAKTQRQVDWLAESTRQVDLPARSAPPDAGCYVHVAQRSAACLDVARPSSSGLTDVGNYQPLPYLLPGVVLHVASSPQPALRWGRLASLMPALALLALAVALLWDGRAVSLLGPALAVTPMVLFCAASLTGSGLEIAAGIAFVAALLRVRRDLRDGGEPPARVWGAVGLAGFVLALSRSASPLWVVLALVLWLALVGPVAAWAAVKRRRAAWGAGAAVLAGLVLNRVWEAAYGPDAPFRLVNARQGLEDGFGQLVTATNDLVLGPGYLEYSPPLWMVIVWFALVAALVAAAFAVARRSDRWVLLGTIAAVGLVPLALWVITIRHTGFGLQGRHVLPFVVALPLLAGELVREGRARLSAATLRRLTVAVGAGAALVQFGGWFRNAQRSAFGTDEPLLGWKPAEWSPPVGWGLWMLLALAGALLVASLAVRRPA